MHKPKWFRNGYVFVSFAPTIGINKDGEELWRVDGATGLRTSELDNQALQDVDLLVKAGATSETSRWVTSSDLGSRLMAVPSYFDDRSIRQFDDFMAQPELAEFESHTLGSLIDQGAIVARSGHGSPSADLRSGSIPYIKVSDLRAGQVNINPTNQVSSVVAHRYWRGKESGLKAYDLLTPIRTSKNIGDFAVLMPGQENVVLTKEILVLRAGATATFDSFFLMWALSLRVVRDQWQRIVFMQTNREDVGQRYREIMLPIPRSRVAADHASQPFRDYYLGTQNLRERFVTQMKTSGFHYIHLVTDAAIECDLTHDDAIIADNETPPPDFPAVEREDIA